MAASQRKYTIDQRQRLVTLVLDEGMPQMSAARLVGIEPHSAAYYTGWERKRRAAAQDAGAVPETLTVAASPDRPVAADMSSAESGSANPTSPEIPIGIQAALSSVCSASDHAFDRPRIPSMVAPVSRVIRLLSCREVLEVLALPDDDLAALRRVAGMA